MDRKKEQLFKYYYNKFVERSFDEKDLYSFLQLVREDAEDIQVIKELGDFLGSRGKSMGYIRRHLEECEEIAKNFSKNNNRKKIEDVFSFKEIRNGFNALFLKHGLNKLSAEIINDFVLCIISLAQSISFTPDETKRNAGYLSFAVSSKEIFLMGNIKVLNKGRYIPVTFQVMAANNIYEDVTPQDKDDTPYLFNDELMEVINIDKELVITFL
ncbi:hypothetical protein [Sporosarcina sp. G11-34]|uniref:hypothetical protein n=1 Tax=Sporosarcina sp. G11-34 TaxID=2849605 RepID=UPI0022A8F6B9|nr:hypothetical protein [Sporosarcina sp. G11-34]MCZ2257368.1 hypothetical protein [Sporosarcina sp. G11-34]